MAGFYKDIDSPDISKAHKARAYSDLLDAYLGEGWQEIQSRDLQPQARRKAYVDLYDSRLKQYYPGAIYTEIPVASNNPNYYLFFATRNSAGKQIMSNILKKIRLKGNVPLDGFQSQEASTREIVKDGKLDNYFLAA